MFFCFPSFFFGLQKISWKSSPNFLVFISVRCKPFFGWKLKIQSQWHSKVKMITFFGPFNKKHLYWCVCVLSKMGCCQFFSSSSRLVKFQEKFCNISCGTQKNCWEKKNVLFLHRSLNCPFWVLKRPNLLFFLKLFTFQNQHTLEKFQENLQIVAKPSKLQQKQKYDKFSKF